MIRLDLFRAPFQRDLARLLDDHGKEQLEGFGCNVGTSWGVGEGREEGRSRCATRARNEGRRTYHDWGGLCDLADLFVLLHDLLYTRLRPVSGEVRVPCTRVAWDTPLGTWSACSLFSWLIEGFESS